MTETTCPARLYLHPHQTTHTRSNPSSSITSFRAQFSLLSGCISGLSQVLRTRVTHAKPRDRHLIYPLSKWRVARSSPRLQCMFYTLQPSLYFTILVDNTYLIVRIIFSFFSLRPQQQQQQSVNAAAAKRSYCGGRADVNQARNVVKGPARDDCVVTRVGRSRATTPCGTPSLFGLGTPRRDTSKGVFRKSVPTSTRCCRWTAASPSGTVFRRTFSRRAKPFPTMMTTVSIDWNI